MVECESENLELFRHCCRRGAVLYALQWKWKQAAYFPELPGCESWRHDHWLWIQSGKADCSNWPYQRRTGRRKAVLWKNRRLDLPHWLYNAEGMPGTGAHGVFPESAGQPVQAHPRRIRLHPRYDSGRKPDYRGGIHRCLHKKQFSGWSVYERKALREPCGRSAQ